MVDLEIIEPAPIVVQVSELSEEFHEALAGKANLNHTHPLNTIQGLTQALADKDVMIDGAMQTHLAASDPHPQYSKDTDLAAHVTNLAAHLPTAGVSNAQIADDAAIAWGKISKTGAVAADVGAAPSSHTHTADQISGLVSSSFPGTSSLLSYTLSQSSVYASNEGTYATMTDGTGTTGAATGSGNSWIKADLGANRYITRMDIQGGNVSGFGQVSGYWNTDGVVLEVSADDTTWLRVATSRNYPLAANDESIVKFWMPYISCRYIRWQSNGYLALSGWWLYGF